MDELDDLSKVWRSQAVPITPFTAERIVHRARQQMKKIRNGHLTTLAILGVTVFTLIYILVVNERDELTTGLAFMMGSLGLRMGIEYRSLRNLAGIRQDLAMVDCRERLTHHHRRRLRINRIYTPLLYGMYCLGFGLLLPVFRESLPAATFTLVWTSGAAILVFFAVFLAGVMKRETKTYHHLLKLMHHDNF